MKKFITFSIALAMVTSLCSCGSDKSSSESSSAESTTAAEAVTPEEQFLQDISGTYDELFTVICDPKYDQLWLDKCEAIVGADMAADCAEMLKTACTGTVYGEEAVKKYNPSVLKQGWNEVDGETIYYIDTPALGLWTAKDKYQASLKNNMDFCERMIQKYPDEKVWKQIREWNLEDIAELGLE